jgi:hypothetical protein
MIRGITFLATLAMLLTCSCAKKDSAVEPTPSAEASKPAEAAAAADSTGGPRAVVHLTNGTKVPGAIVASSKTDMVVAGDDGIERKIPLNQIKSVEYGQAAQPAARASREAPQSAQPRKPATESAPPASAPSSASTPTSASTPAAATATPPPPPPVTTKTYELPAGSEISVRTDELIDSETATEGQTFSAQVTRDATDANGDVVIPRRTPAQVVIKSATKGGRFRGASDLVLDLQAVTISGKPYAIDTTDVAKKSKSGVGANRRTAEYTGGGAALGAIIGAIAGGGKGAAIGAGAGAGAGALTQVLTRGRTIKVPAESVLTFNLDKSLKVTAKE